MILDTAYFNIGVGQHTRIHVLETEIPNMCYLALKLDATNNIKGPKLGDLQTLLMCSVSDT